VNYSVYRGLVERVLAILAPCVGFENCFILPFPMVLSLHSSLTHVCFVQYSAQDLRSMLGTFQSSLCGPGLCLTCSVYLGLSKLSVPPSTRDFSRLCLTFPYLCSNLEVLKGLIWRIIVFHLMDHSSLFCGIHFLSGFLVLSERQVVNRDPLTHIT
jgi:hypothetical protein